MLSKTKQNKLIVLSNEMSVLTAPECAKTCMAPHSCCAPEYCEMAKQYAKKEFGVQLKVISDGPLPYMGPTGCTVAPHLRPLCTLHTCQITSFGFKPNDREWTEKYFELRNKIEILL